MLTEFENFSITRELTSYLNNLNNDGTVQGLFFSRVVGLVSIPFCCLADAATHISLCAIKVIVGLGVSFYNSLAYAFHPAYTAPKEFEFSSSLVHLFRTTECLSKGCILPFLCLLNPERTDGVMQINKDEVETLQIPQTPGE